MAVFPREQSSGQSFCMEDKLVRSWPLRAKFVDDLTILEIIPRNSPPVMNFLVNDVDSYASEHKMVLNSSKCKCIVLDFLDSTWSPIFTGNMVVGRVRTFKLLNVTIVDDLKWDFHCDTVLRKANKCQYALRQLKKCGINDQDIIFNL